MVKAVWNGVVVAQSNETVEIEGNHYFPPSSIKKEYFKDSLETSICPWKGEAKYYDLVVNKNINSAAAWYYPQLKPDAIKKIGKDFTNYVAFWKGVEVKD